MMACPTCSKRVLSHAKGIQCYYCENTYHMKCISLETDYISQLKENHENWLCGSCITDIFPFNKLENEDDFRQAILMKLENELIISNLIYNPHESNSFDFSYCDEFDPDANFFCQQNIFSGYTCPYYTEDGLNGKMSSFMSQDEQHFSICHMSIRSIRANLQNFESYLQLLNIEFSVIGITETWFDDTSCLLYSMQNYNCIENHRKNQSGGGVAILLRDGIPYKQRTDCLYLMTIVNLVLLKLKSQYLDMKKRLW